LKNVSFKVEDGEFLIIIGLSGSGKSTLLRCINRLIDPTEGDIFWDGVNLAKLEGEELRAARRKIGMIFQHFNLVKRSTVMTNVLSGRLGYSPTMQSLLHRFNQSDKESAWENLNRLGIEDQAHKRADELSGGQQQRVGIARALMQNPELILADEPVASLDPVLAHSILNYLEKLNQEDQMTIVCSLHYLDLVQRYSTRVLGLRDGEIVYRGTREQIRSMSDEEFKEIYGEDAQRVTEGLEGSLEEVA
jgi:phosphonate transport system ATP-binding protein